MKLRQFIIFALLITAFLIALTAMGQLGRLKAITLSDLCSFIAVVVSAYTLWRSNLVPFKPAIVAGSRVHLMRSSSLDPLIKIPLTLANTGVQSGFIEDLAILLQPPGKKSTVLLSSYAESLNENLYMGDPKEAPEPILKTFQGVYLKNRESVSKVLCFEAFDKELKPSFDYQVGRYNLTILMRTTNQEKWIKTDSIDFTIDENDMKVIAKPKKDQADGEKIIVGVQIKFTKKREESLKHLHKIKNNKSEQLIENKNDFNG